VVLPELTRLGAAVSQGAEEHNGLGGLPAARRVVLPSRYCRRRTVRWTTSVEDDVVVDMGIEPAWVRPHAAHSDRSSVGDLEPLGTPGVRTARLVDETDEEFARPDRHRAQVPLMVGLAALGEVGKLGVDVPALPRG
jgi:hypothetical protein